MGVPGKSSTSTPKNNATPSQNTKLQAKVKKRKDITPPDQSSLDKKLRHNSDSDTSFSDVDSIISNKSWPDWSDTSITIDKKDINTQIEYTMSDLNESMNSTIEGDMHSQSIIANPATIQPSAITCHQPVGIQPQFMMHPLQQPQNPVYMPSQGQAPLQNQQHQHIPFPNISGQQQVSFLSDHDIQRITNSLHESLMHSLTTIVDAAVTKRVVPLQTKIESLEEQVKQININMNKMKIEHDNTDQYSRRLCVLISNIPESEGESTDHQVLEVSRKSGANISPNDIDRSHRIIRKANPESPIVHNPNQPRDIIVKFLSYTAKSSFMKGRKTLRQNHESMFINEQLTPFRRELAYQCRQLKKSSTSPILDTWTFDGTIFVKTQIEGKPIKIQTHSDLTKYGYKPTIKPTVSKAGS